MLLKDGAGCGEFMGQDNLERLSNCNQDVSAHLRRYHLSKESLSEYDFILLRAEFLNVATSQLENMLVCSRHRGNLGVHWRGSTPGINCRIFGQLVRNNFFRDCVQNFGRLGAKLIFENCAFLERIEAL
jgi:hypothetical protein